MPNIKDQSTVNAIARAFTSNGRNKTQGMITVGYDKAYADSGKGQKSVYGNIRVIEAIKAIDDKMTETLDHDRQQAISQLNANITALDAIILAQPMNVAAVTARTGTIRELNAISNLHKATIVAEHTPDQPKGKEAEALATAAREYKIKLAGTGS